MIFSVHPDGPVPIYEQIVAQVIYGVAAGTWKQVRSFRVCVN
jgi:DNA-binding transcriptional regulator YhcF (GntR family)